MIEALTAFMIVLGQPSEIALERATACTHIKPLMEGDEAPCDGLWLPEGRYTELLQAELKADDLKGQLNLKTLYAGELEKLYKQAIKPRKIPWYRRLSFNRVVFYTLGVATTALAIYGGTKLVQAAAKQ